MPEYRWTGTWGLSPILAEGEAGAESLLLLGQETSSLALLDPWLHRREIYNWAEGGLFLPFLMLQIISPF